jgi:hypothetical protein
MQQSISVISSRFENRNEIEFNSLLDEIKALPQLEKPLKLIDTTKYDSHVWEKGGFGHIPKGDLVQIDLGKIGSFNTYLSKEIYIDDSKRIELKTDSLQLIVALDTTGNYGLLLFVFELNYRDVSPLEGLAENKIFRYFRGPGKDELNKFKVFEGQEKIEEVSLHDIFKLCLPAIDEKVLFPTPKPTQFHFLDKSEYISELNKDSYCYNILRLPASKNEEAEERYFRNSDHHTFENSSIYFFGMNEGAIIMSPYKSPKQLFPGFFPAFFLALIRRELVLHLVKKQAETMDVKNLLNNESSQIQMLNELRKKIYLSTFLTSLPISQYSEIQSIFRMMNHNFSGEDLIELKLSLNEIITLIQEENDKESGNREKSISVFLGVLGITGVISFIFDYFFISKNEKILDSLEFPLNLMPLFIFILTFLFVWRFIRKK